MRAFSPLLMLVLGTACSAAPPPVILEEEPPAEANAPGQATKPGGTAKPGATEAAAPVRFATTVSIQEVALFQGTRISLAQAGVKNADRRMPVVAGRDGLLRVYVVPKAQGAHAVTGELLLVRDGNVTTRLQSQLNVVAASREDAPETTFNFDVPGALIAPDTQFVVRLVTDSGTPLPASTVNPAQYPTNGSPDAFDARRSADKLRVVIVPVRYMADGSGRVPDTSANVLDAIRKRMLEFYPVPDVEVTVRQPISFSSAINGAGAGWDALLTRVTQLRLEDNAAPDVYYYGAFAAAPSLTSFCTGDCMLGLSNFADDPNDVAHRASVGALYPVNDAIDTVPHEIGHAHGREHAPCGGAAGTDPAYPYGNAVIGSWGYSIVTKSLKRPTLFDQMSYCTPAWQSDYTYRALFDRVSAVASLAGHAGTSHRHDHPPEARTYRILRVSADGTMTWAGAPFQTTLDVVGVPHAMHFVDEAGAIVGDVTAHGYKMSHLPGGTLIVPWEKVSARAARIQLDASSGLRAITAPVRARFGAFAPIAVQ